MKVYRTIHPIGQGGFASEIHHDNSGTPNGLFIYDCGCRPITEKSQHVAASTLPERDIDILFISHFHEDHISLIPNLIKKRKVKCVIIPFLTDKIKVQIKAIFKSPELAGIFISPEKCFGESARVVKVKSIEDADKDNTEKSLKLDSLPDTINSGTSITTTNWEYVPFNIKSKERTKKFEEMCKHRKIDNELLSNIDYVLENKKELSEIYKIIEGGINQNSIICIQAQLLIVVFAVKIKFVAKKDYGVTILMAFQENLAYLLAIMIAAKF